MSQFLHFLGALRGCADFRAPTAVFRFKQKYQNQKENAMHAHHTRLARSGVILCRPL